MSAVDLSGRHELDIVAVEPGVTGYPRFDEIALGVECKSHANFKKSIVKEVLGIRRELCLLSQPQQSILTQLSPKNPTRIVPADPASEYWLAFCDPQGLQYSSSPAAFGINFYNW